tara:strand:+ start:2467 stop:2724 length:258 start_codon:yes stop_codon:yes gene_type:complete
LKIINLKDAIKDIDPESEIEHEMTYRRGYIHGYDSGIDDMRAFDTKKVIGFFDNMLRKWRYGKKPFKLTFQIPPNIDEEVKNANN